MPAKPQRKTEEKFVVRLPAGMRERIADNARNNTRSMNGEIVFRLARADELEVELKRANEVIDRLLAEPKDNSAQAQEA